MIMMEIMNITNHVIDLCDSETRNLLHKYRRCIFYNINIYLQYIIYIVNHLHRVFGLMYCFVPSILKRKNNYLYRENFITNHAITGME